MKPAGFIQVDVDGLWAVRACYQRPEKDTFREDPCWDEGVTRLEALFRDLGIPAAFFIVGRDLEVDRKRRLARKLIYRGHELGNHSYTHPLGLTASPMGLILGEIRRTDLALRQLGATPAGFRSPGYDVDGRIHRALRRGGYVYDASMLPTYFGPALRLASSLISGRWLLGRRQFGRISHGRAPRAPYFPRRHKIRKQEWPEEIPDLVEIPVGVTPGLHLPLTGAMLLTMSASRRRHLFLRLANKRRPVLLLLHAIDAVDCRRPIVMDDRRPRTGGFAMSGEKKEQRLRAILGEFARYFEIQRADEFARAMLATG